MEDAPLGPSPLAIRQSSRVSWDEEEEEGEDLLTPLLQSRRPSRQYVSISPPPTETSASVTRAWHPRPLSGIRSLSSPELWSAPRNRGQGQEQQQQQQQQLAGPSTPRVPLIHIRDESPGGNARETCLSVVSEDAVARLPLTPFPPWVSNSDREGRETCDGRREQGKRGTREAVQCRCGDGRDVRKGVVHATVLAAQCVAFMGLFCLWVDVAVCETAWDSASDSDPAFWYKLWVYFQPVLGVLGLFTVAAILVYEVSGLSDGVFLGVQAVVLVAGGAAGLCVVWWAFEQGSRVIVGAAVGTAAMMFGVGMFGFVRAAVVWWLEEG